MMVERGKNSSEAFKDVATILIYEQMHKIKGPQTINNRRQRRLWKAIDDPFQAFANKFRRKVWEEVERAILYGKER